MSIKRHIIGDENIAVQYFKEARRIFNLMSDGTTKYKYVGDCTIKIVRRDADNGIETFIPDTISGFIFHPRSGEEKVMAIWDGEAVVPYIEGGWGENATTHILERLTTKCPFPIYDEDNASMVLDFDRQKENTVTHLGAKSSYGNYYTIDPSDDTVIYSWKGAPNIHEPVRCQSPIPCIGDGFQSCSGFWYDIYSGGEIVGRGPKFGNTYAYIYALKKIDGIFYAVVKHMDGYVVVTSFVSTEKLSMDGFGWTVISSTLKTFRDLPWFITANDCSICSSGDTFTTDNNSTLTISKSGNENFTTIQYSGSANLFFEEQSVYSAVSITHSDSYVIKGDSDYNYSTAKQTRSKYLPDVMQITANAGVYCAAPMNSEGHDWSCAPCVPSISWQGPVEPFGDTGCVKLITECYPPGEHTVTISAEYKCGTITVSGSIDIVITGSAGYWGGGSCDFSFIIAETSSDPKKCSTLTNVGQGYCDVYGVSAGPPAVGPQEISGNVLKQFYGVNTHRDKIESTCPCVCVGTVGETGVLGGAPLSSTTTSYGPILYKTTGDEISCNHPAGENHCFWSITNITAGPAPFSTHSWVCL